MKWLVKIERDIDGEIFGGEILYGATSVAGKRGGEFILVDGPKLGKDFIKLEFGDAVTIVENEKPKKVKDKYDEMSKAVYLQAYKIFNTQSSDSINADSATWDLMQDDPSYFVGIKSTHDINEEIKKGDILDNILKVSTYSAFMIEKKKEYALWRFNRKEAFREDRDDINNER